MRIVLGTWFFLGCVVAERSGDKINYFVVDPDLAHGVIIIVFPTDVGFIPTVTQ